MREVFVIRSKDPLEMEGYPGVVAVIQKKPLADKAAATLNNAQEEHWRKVLGDRWRKRAVEYEVESWPLLTTPEQIDEMLENETS